MDTVKNLTGKLTRGVKNTISKIASPKTLGIVVLGVVIVSLIVGYVVFNGKVNNGKSKGTNYMMSSLKNYPNKINNFSSSDERYTHNLRDYYIMSSYNSCCNSDFQGTHVDQNALLEVIL